MKDETLDELIDRVAAKMTAVSASAPRDRSWSILLAQRRRDGYWRLSVAAAGFAGALVLAVWINWADRVNSPERERVITATQPLAFLPLRHAPHASTVTTEPAVDSSSPLTVVTASHDLAEDARVSATSSDEDAIPELMVEGLHISELPAPEIAQVAPLKVDALDIPDIPDSPVDVTNKESWQ